MSDKGHLSNSSFSRVPKAFIVVLVILSILVVVAIGLIVILLSKPTISLIEPETTKNSSGGRGTVITKDNVDEYQQNQQESETVQDGYYVTSMSIDWHFDGRVSRDAYIANATENTRTVYFDLHLKDTSEVIYSSPYIPVGAEIKGLTIDKELDPGTYDTILVYHLVDDDEKEVSTLSVALKIHVK